MDNGKLVALAAFIENAAKRSDIRYTRSEEIACVNGAINTLVFAGIISVNEGYDLGRRLTERIKQIEGGIA